MMKGSDKPLADSMHKQNLAEWIYDENKLITYHYLSVTLGVHVNLAKQMLYEFYNDEIRKNKSEGNKLEAVYYVSGVEENKDETDVETDKMSKHTSTLCSSNNLEQVKNKLSKIFSIHIYSLQLVGCKETLENAVKETLLLTNFDGKSGVDFGPFKLLIPQITTKKKVMEPINNSSSRTKPDDSLSTNNSAKPGIAKILKSEVKSEERRGQGQKKSLNTDASKEIVNKVEKEDSIKKIKPDADSKVENSSSSSTASKKKESGKSNGNKDRLKNMFAAAAAKPREPKIKKERSPSPDSDETEDTSTSRTSTRKQPIKSVDTRKSVSKKSVKAKAAAPQRKRIKVLSSSSDDESDSNKSSSEGSDSESPIPRRHQKSPESPVRKRRQLQNSESPIPKRRQIMSDSESDDEDFQESKKQKSCDIPPAALVPPCKPGRKHVAKIVTTRVVDEDGFTVTKKEQVIVSESDSDSEMKSSNSSENPKLKTDIKEVVSPVTNGRKKDAKKAVSPSPTKKKSNQQANGGVKSKQASIMSFFQKKP